MRYESSVVINRPIEEVWAFLADPFNIPRYGFRMLTVRPTSPGPMGLGTTLQARAVIFGLEFRGSGAVTEWDPPHAHTLTVKGVGIRSGTVRQTFEATVDGTKVVRMVEIDP